MDTVFGLPYYVWSGILGAAIGVISVITMLFVTDECVRKWIVAAWLVVPAIWFFGEYHMRRDSLNPDQLQRLKDSQDLASKIWAGVAAALATLYLKG